MLFVATTTSRLWTPSSSRALSLSWRTCGRASFSTSAPRCRDSVADEQEAQITSKAAKKAQWQRNSKSTAFIDTLTLHASAGTGGDGCVSFSRAKYVPYGPPSGGNGGSGGSIYIRAVPQLRSLARVPSSVTAGDGQHGQGEWQGGKRGKDVVVEVPVGTVVRVRESGGERAWVNEAEREVSERRGEYEDELMQRLGRYRLKKRRSEGQLQQQAAQEEQEDDEHDEQGYANHIDNYDYGVSSSRSSSSSRSDYFDTEAASRQLERRSLVSSVWRHHPGSTPAPDEEVAASDDDDLDASEDVYSGEDFHRAEERYALLERDRRYAAQRRGSSLFEKEIDLDTPTSSSTPPLLIASGGPGGQGNAFFLSGASRSPKLATRGRHGQRVEVSLELKSPADVGMVGLPNAGKSSLLQAWTGASRKGAKVGGWEFTTLHPNVGVMRLDPEGRLVGVGRGRIGESAEQEEIEELQDGDQEEESTSRSWPTSSERRLLVADLPGLILGASDNVGLGHSFLRHAERCAALIYVVDVSSARATPWDDIAVLRRELEQYSPGLSKKVAAVVANKCDALGPAMGEGEEDGEGKRETVEVAREKLARLRKEVHPLPVLPVSAMWRMGVEGAAKVVHDLAKVRENAAKEPLDTVEGQD